MNGGDLGHFTLLEKIGEGGMGRVYRARDPRLDRFVAIKLVSEALSHDRTSRARFVQEARAASALNHPNIITIHEIGEDNGQTFIVMELVDGKPLSELIPRKGMRFPEAMRVAVQIADALSAAHAAGIVHRDLKPSNIMVDVHGRVKVLDFGLAKQSPIARTVAVGEDVTTLALSLDTPAAADGAIVGSFPYMSPEQAEGKPVDVRSDIFSFGSVLYEMVSGRRAFHGESVASTLAAVIGNDPEPVSQISVTSPPEIDRLITRCLRKDVNRRSQSMADVKLALEELRDDSESGNLTRPPEAAAAKGRRWMIPAFATACLLAIAAALGWVYSSGRTTQSSLLQLLRASPDDGYGYELPAISPDGQFIALVSDRGGKDELWLQQVGGHELVQLTHSKDDVAKAVFFPDGRQIAYISMSVDQRRSAIAVISALGGEPQVLVEGGPMANLCPMLSPDGSRIAYFGRGGTPEAWRLMTIPAKGGQPRELQSWARTPKEFFGRAGWTPDSKYLICQMLRKSPATNADEPEWYSFPLDGSDPTPMGAADAFRAAGLARVQQPMLVAGDRVLFGEGQTQTSIWDIRIAPAPWHVVGSPRQLAGGTTPMSVLSVSTAGTAAVNVSDYNIDFYVIPLSSQSQPSGPIRRLTHDRRYKDLLDRAGGHPAKAYFKDQRTERHLTEINYYALDLDAGKQTPASPTLPPQTRNAKFSVDGRQFVYMLEEGDSPSIRLVNVGADRSEERVLCTGCTAAYGFSPDGRFLLYEPGAPGKTDPHRKLTIHMMELASGKDRLWIEDATDSAIVAGNIGPTTGWPMVRLMPLSGGKARQFLVPWREDPVPQSEWIPMPEFGKAKVGRDWRASPTGDSFYFFAEKKLMAVRFDRLKRAFGVPFEIRLPVGSPVTPLPGGKWTIRSAGIVFQHEEVTNASVWLMKLPR
jgi:eukaryotic-like serine/threonine-protein kinase